MARWGCAALAVGLSVACGGGGGSKGGAAPPADVPVAPTDTTGGTGGPSPGPVPGPGCVPQTCAQLGRTCGQVDDGCGGNLFCGSCAEGTVCGAGNVCVAPAANCAPTTCQAAGKSCGRIPNGCGGTLDCGVCAGQETCGGAGVANVCGAPPVAGGSTLWVQVFGGADAERVEKVRSDAAGNVYAVGTVTGEGGPKAFVRKHGSNGTLVWEKRADLQAQAYFYFSSLAVSPSGGVHFALQAYCSTATCGPDFGGGAIASGLVKLDTAGAFQWQRSSGYVPSVAAGPGGEVAFVHYGGEGGPTLRVAGPDGSDRWSSSSLSSVQALAFAPDGTLYAGWTEYSPAYQNKLTRFGASGAVLWTRNAIEYVVQLATSGRGTLVATEGTQLAVYEAVDGAQRFRVSLPMWPVDLAVRPGIHDVVEAVVVGQDQAGCNHLEARAHDLAGAFRWVRLIGPSAGCGGAPQATGVTVLDSGDVVVGGNLTTITDFGTGNRTPNGASDGFLLQLAP